MNAYNFSSSVVFLPSVVPWTKQSAKKLMANETLDLPHMYKGICAFSKTECLHHTSSAGRFLS